MFVPLLIAGASASLAAVYNFGKAYDNFKYWEDYRRRTGYSPKYRFTSGSMDWMNSVSKGLGYPAFGYRLYSRGYHPSRFNNDYGMYR